MIEHAANATTLTLGRVSLTKYHRAPISIARCESFKCPSGVALSLTLFGWHWTCYVVGNAGTYRTLWSFTLPHIFWHGY